MTAAVGEEGECRRFEHPYRAHDAVPAPVFARTARVVEELVALDAHWILHLEGLDGGVAHPHMDAGRTGAFAARPLAAADGLVVSPAGAADYRVVHCALALSGEVGCPRKGGHHDIRDAIARFDVPGHDC